MNQIDFFLMKVFSDNLGRYINLQYDRIPEMDHPLASAWKQPKADKITLCGKWAIMHQATFNQLADYSNSRPSAVYVGKMWTSEFNGKWFLLWWDVSEKGAEFCKMRQREIVVLPDE